MVSKEEEFENQQETEITPEMQKALQANVELTQNQAKKDQFGRRGGLLLSEPLRQELRKRTQFLQLLIRN